MKSVKYSLMCGATAIVAFTSFTAGTLTVAEAGGFAIREQSAIGQGTSFAGIAAGGQLSSMFWNPAALGGVEGTSTESVYTGILPNSKINDGMTNTVNTGNAGADAAYTATFNGLPVPGNVGLEAFVPSSYGGSQLTNDLFVGFSVNAPFGLATKADRPSKTSFHAGTAKIFTTDAKLNLAYRINDAFTVGLGAGVMYAKVRLTNFPDPLAPGAGTELVGDDWAPTFSAGITYRPMEGTEIGVGFRAASSFSLQGTQRIEASTSANPLLTGNAGTHNINATLVMPETITIGLRQRITDSFDLLAGFEWTNWSRVGTSNIHGSPLGSKLTLEYQDAWYASVGGEYAYNENLTLRTGFGFEKSPIPTEHRNLRLPDADRIWASAGLSYNVNEKFGFDLGYTHLFVDKVKVSGASSTGSLRYDGEAEGSVDIISASMRYKFQPEPMFAGDEPIARKY